MSTAARPVAAPVVESAPSRYRYDERAGRYRVAGSGRFVREQAVRDEIDRVLEKADGRARALGELLRMRGISVRDWEREMRLLVKDTQLTGLASAKGGWAQLSAADFGRIGAETRRQYAYLRRFRRQIEQGLPLDGRFLRRAELYTEVGRATHRAEEARVRDRIGYSEYRNVRHAADSCAGCVAESAKGWVPIGDLVPVGQRTCLARCKCSYEYRKPAQADGAG